MFTPDLQRNGSYRIGAKGAEEDHADSSVALSRLNAMAVPRVAAAEPEGHLGYRQWCCLAAYRKEVRHNMTIPTATEILALLRAATPQPTSEAPCDARGIYGLFDHSGTYRYIGSTSSQVETFYKRIHQRHRSGSENKNHYFSNMYNSGRLWRRRNDPATKADGDVAKKLRNAFIARHCGAVWVPLPDHADISGLEAQVIVLAPAEMISWNRHGMEFYDAPKALVDALIEELGPILSSPCDIWINRDLKWKRMVRKVVFAERLPYCRENGLRTAKTTLPFKVLSDSGSPESFLVPKGHFEPG